MQKSRVSFVWNFARSNLFWVLIFAVFAGFWMYCEFQFPSQLRDLVPQKFQSHPPRNLASYLRSLEQMRPTIYNSSLASKCEDVEISKTDKAYCINENSEIVEIDTIEGKVKKIGNAAKGRTFGLRLSKDQRFLYFANSAQGLCQYTFETGLITQLATQYNGEFLLSLNSIQVHPTNPNLLYITQCSTRVPISIFTIDILMNNPLGRVFEFNKETNELSLLTDGLYFANGLTFQMYRGLETLLVAEMNRFRLTRVYLTGQKRGMKQVAVDELDVYLDNVKTNEKGEIWIAGPSLRNWFLYLADYHPWIRRILSRIPPKIAQQMGITHLFGGLKITFSQDKEKYEVEYLMWKSLPKFCFATTLHEKNNKLYVSSLLRSGVIVFDQINQKLNNTGKQSETEQEEL